MRINDILTIENVDNLIIEEADNGVFLSVPSTDTLNGEGSVAIQGISNLKRWMCLSRQDYYWVGPHFGTDISGVPRETQFLLWERNDGSFGILLPLISGDLRTVVCGNGDGCSLQFGGGLQGEENGETLIACCAEGDDPYSLTRNTVQKVSERLKTFSLREEKEIPGFIKYFGWCTWDAFYHEVDAEKVYEGLRTFREGGLVPGFMILDDGWLDTEGDHLNDMPPDAEKFSEGLAPMIEKVKDEFGVRIFGVWHAFEGYWAGLAPEGSLARKYRLIRNTGKIRPWLGEKDVPLDLYMIHPEDVGSFYRDFYTFLEKEGVDLVKVDGQSALEVFSEGKTGRVGTMAAFQKALQKEASEKFDNNLIHCMSNGSDVAYNMDTSVVFRNSNDYLPRHPDLNQRGHIRINAVNNIWSSQFSIPDWDMFQSHGPYPEYHAASRALSGGPVYVSDKPGQQDFSILNRLCTSDGKAILCDRPALPAVQTLFTDCINEPVPLKITNIKGDIGILGLFHCYEEAEKISGRFSPNEIPDLPDGEYAVYLSGNGEIVKGSEGTEIPVELDRFEFEIAVASPVHGGIAVFGLKEKYNSAGTVLRYQVNENSIVSVLADSGTGLFYVDSQPAEVTVNGRAAEYTYSSESGLLSVECTKTGENEIQIRK